MKIGDYDKLPLVKADQKRQAPNKGKGLKEEIRLAAEKYGVNQASVTSRIYKARRKGVHYTPDQAASLVRPGKPGRPRGEDKPKKEKVTQKKWTRAEYDKLARMVVGGMSISRAAKRMGVSYSAAHRHMGTRFYEKSAMDAKESLLASEMDDEYHDGARAYPSESCPFPKSGRLRQYCAWWAGWHDARRGMA